MSFTRHPAAEQDIAQAMDSCLEAAGLAVADRLFKEFRRVLEADLLAPPPRMAGALKKTQRTVIDAMQANVRRLA